MKASEDDEAMRILNDSFYQGGPMETKTHVELQLFVKIAEELMVEKGAVLRGDGIMPYNIDRDMIQLAHEDHLQSTMTKVRLTAVFVVLL
ncbi:hypothetical protein NDU88_004833 [Pleurodeles waltl]|uniref:Uncharacterized protein n=1 Tax=Pleurodeles waltl TaxID=8319 RepID=A0AAV7M7G3_PLEWA|nr:hypothetical protein NDU88_004833 [Pleurodeles waltl]